MFSGHPILRLFRTTKGTRVSCILGGGNNPMKVALFLVALFLVLTSSPGLQASSIRMMSLANPWLTIPDPDTDWIYNPAYILYAPNQAFGEYIFGHGRQKIKTESSFGPFTFTGHSEENRWNHTGEIGFIHRLGMGKFGMTGAYSHFRFENEYHNFSDQDMDLAAAYAIPLSSEFSGGVSISYNKLWDEGPEKFDFHRWDVSLGISWQPIPKFRTGLSGGGGGYHGDDIRGSHAHLLANSDYIVCEGLTIPITVQGRWDEKKWDFVGRRSFGGMKREEPWWDILFKTGTIYVIDKNSKFLIGGEIYYSYANWKSEIESIWIAGFVGTSNSSVERRRTHSIGTRIGLEGKIYEGLIARMGIYYNYSFFDGGSSIPSGVLGVNSEEDGWSQTLGIGLGLGYSPIRRLRFDLGFDIPFINKEHSKVDFIPLPRTERMEVNDLLYRVGLNLTYFF